ncbi:MAG TPA: hypothetical protein VM282_22580 [Acidimicrobiales bacterium]|nr:hypothetical protein [Acidimicrobiales bacterium]
MSTRRTTIRRTVAGAIIIGAVSFAGAGTASADHVHSKQVGNGACVLLAQDSGEGEVDLPFATSDQVDANRAHPLHLLVHLGQPGGNFAIGVAGTASDPCNGTDNYLND